MPIGHLVMPEDAGVVLAAPVHLDGKGHYLHWGFVQISVANVVVVAVIAACFIAALFLPFPKSKGRAGR